jgi:prefoldin subunit 5
LEEYKMREQLLARLSVLKQEFEAGQAQLQALEQQQVSLRKNLAALSAAIQVLEELLAKPEEVQKVPARETHKPNN